MSGTFSPGDRVVWQHEPRGGYGYTVRVPATVIRAKTRVLIEYQARSPGQDWQTRQRWVTPDRLRRVVEP